jgi:hypothetical protein
MHKLSVCTLLIARRSSSSICMPYVCNRTICIYVHRYVRTNVWMYICIEVVYVRLHTRVAKVDGYLL